MISVTNRFFPYLFFVAFLGLTFSSVSHAAAASELQPEEPLEHRVQEEGGGGAAAAGTIVHHEADPRVEKGLIPFPQEMVVFKARNKKEWQDLEFRVFPVKTSGEWNSYFQALDRQFAYSLRKSLYRFLRSKKTQEALTESDEPSEEILKQFQGLLQEEVRKARIWHNSCVKKKMVALPLHVTEISILEKKLKEAHPDSLLRAFRYCIRDTRGLRESPVDSPKNYQLIYSMHKPFFDDFFVGFTLSSEDFLDSAVSDRNQKIRRLYNFFPNPGVASSERQSNAPFVAIVYDTITGFPLMNVNLYSRLNGAYQENRYISRNQVSTLLFALMGRELPRRLSLHLHASVLLATESSSFCVKPDQYRVMRDAFLRKGFAEEDPYKAGYYRTNGKFKGFAQAELIEVSRTVDFRNHLKWDFCD